jgi:hypothetical protein
MHQIKFFCGIEGELSLLEKQVNSWLAETKPTTIVNVFGNMSPQAILPGSPTAKITADGGSRRFAPSDVFLCIVYQA